MIQQSWEVFPCIQFPVVSCHEKLVERISLVKAGDGLLCCSERDSEFLDMPSKINCCVQLFHLNRLMR